MDYDRLLEMIRPSDIADTYQPVVSLIGLENFLKLCQYAMGSELYFPTLEGILRNTRRRVILQEYNGYNLQELSKKYGLTQSRIRNLLKRRNKP
ncbi:MAG TPA: Mor transcription activator family protein [Lachnospiraceae bacterium]|nr:Mor transcription activator family protein [Lachnospiraceae bacterium]